MANSGPVFRMTIPVVALLASFLLPATSYGSAFDRCQREVFGDLREVSGQVAGSVEEAIDVCTQAIKYGYLSNKDLSIALHARGVAYLTDFQRELALADFN